MARVTPCGPVAPDDPAEDEPFTTVLSKNARRRLRLEEHGKPDKDKNRNSSAELLRCAAAGPKTAPDNAVENQGPGLKTPAQDVELDQIQERNGSPRDWRRTKRTSTEQNDDNSDPLPVWQLVDVGTFTSHYQAVRWMEEEKQLVFRMNMSPAGDFLIRAGSEENVRALEEFAERKPEGIVLVRRVCEVRVVVLGYPVIFPLDPIVGHPAVKKAERCYVSVGRGRRLPTRSVRVTLRGQLPTSLNLGSWGEYACRRFVPEPLRCFRCQAFGHHQKNCARKQDLCGVCGGEHSTRDCLQRRRNGEVPASPLCVNCGARHYAWYRRCPARLRRIPGATPSARGIEDTLPRPSAVMVSYDAAAARLQDAGLPQRNNRRRRRRGRRSTTADAHPHPPALSTPGEVTTTTRQTTHTHEQKKRTRTAVGDGAVAKEPRTLTKSATATPGRRSQPTQTRGCWSFSEAEIKDLLIRFEHFLAQEREAKKEENSHEPALHCIMRHLKEDRPISSTLPVARPLKNPPRCRYHRGEKDWVHFKVNRVAEKAPVEEEEDDPTYVPTQKQCNATPLEPTTEAHVEHGRGEKDKVHPDKENEDQPNSVAVMVEESSAEMTTTENRRHKSRQYWNEVWKEYLASGEAYKDKNKRNGNTKKDTGEKVNTTVEGP